MNHEQETIVTAPPVLVVVVPCHNEEEVLATTNDRLTALLAAMTQRKEVSERSRILYVDDGSADNTWREIAAFHARDKRVGGISLAARVGQQKALIAGMDVARRYGDAIVSIDADLQDDINVIPDMVSDYRGGGRHCLWREEEKGLRHVVQACYGADVLQADEGHGRQDGVQPCRLPADEPSCRLPVVPVPGAQHLPARSHSDAGL